MSGTAPSARITDIVRQIRGAASAFLDTDKLSKSAREQSLAANASHVMGREGIMIALAELSMANQWSASDVKSASRTAAGLSAKIESEKALATFIGEATKAMLPNVRSHVPSLVNVRDLAWEAEALAKVEDKDTPTPLRKAFSRGYHCLIRMMGEAEDGNVIENVAELLAFAEANNPDHDIGKVKKRLKSIRDLLAAFYDDWPADDLQVCVQAMDDVIGNEKQLKEARASIAAKVEERMQKHKLSDVPTHPRVHPVVLAGGEEPEESEEQDEPTPEDEVEEVDFFDSVLVSAE